MKDKVTLPPAQRAYGPEGTVNSEPMNAYNYFLLILLRSSQASVSIAFGT